MSGDTRMRQVFDRLRHRLLAIPLVFVALGVAVAQVMLWIDAEVGRESIPQALRTTVDGGRAVLSTIAGGLIASITLLLSLMLVAIQLGNTQFSPRTLRDWIGDRTQQLTIGVVLGTTVYCLLALRRTRTFETGDGGVPHITVLLAVLLGLLSLVMVVRSVDHLADSLRVGSVAGRLARETIALIERLGVPGPEADDRDTPPATPFPDGLGDPRVITSDRTGWIQQVDEDALLERVPTGATLRLDLGLGRFVPEGVPLLRIAPAAAVDDDLARSLLDAIAIGDTRTTQQDVGFGILQLVDIALRALSPGVNDPNTANDVIDHLGAVTLAIWARPERPHVRTEETRTLITPRLDHAAYLEQAFAQIRRHGAHDMTVAARLLSTLRLLRAETVRRSLPGPPAPIEAMIRSVAETVEASDALPRDKAFVMGLIDER